MLRTILSVCSLLLVMIGILGGIAFCAVRVEAQEIHEHGKNNLPDWYDPACCNQRDCRPVKDEDVEFDTVNGQIVARYKPTGDVFTRDRFRRSQDERYHVCIYNGNPLCFYDRVGA